MIEEEFTEQEGASMLDGPIPGESLTQDPENPQPWETPPEYTVLEDFIDDMFLNITSEDNLDGVLDPIRKGVPLEDVAQMLLFQAMATGKVTTDLMLSAVEPTIYMLIGLSTFSGIEDPVLYPEDDMTDDDDETLKALQAETGEVDLQSLEPPKGVSKSLVNKLKDGDI